MFLYPVMLVVSTAAALKVYERNIVKCQNGLGLGWGEGVAVRKKNKNLIKYINLSL